MRPVAAIFIIAIFALAAFGQNEQSPIQTKTFGYRDWTYKNLSADGKTNLREFTAGKKLVMVVYWAPWCHNWRHDVAFVQSLHEKYGYKGLGIIGVGMYDPVMFMESNIKQNKLTFPMVYESDSRASRESTVHFNQRRAAGDTRKWGSPWYVFLEPGKLANEGEVLAETVDVVNGELIRPEAEAYIKKKLGLDTTASVEPCDPEKPKTATLRHP